MTFFFTLKWSFFNKMLSTIFSTISCGMMLLSFVMMSSIESFKIVSVSSTFLIFQEEEPPTNLGHSKYMNL